MIFVYLAVMTVAVAVVVWAFLPRRRPRPVLADLADRIRDLEHETIRPLGQDPDHCYECSWKSEWYRVMARPTKSPDRCEHESMPVDFGEPTRSWRLICPDCGTVRANLGGPVA